MNSRLSTLSVGAGQFHADSTIQCNNNNIHIVNASIIKAVLPGNHVLEIDNKGVKSLSMQAKLISGFSDNADILFNGRKIFPVDGVLRINKLLTTTYTLNNASTGFFHEQASLTNDESDLLAAAAKGDYSTIETLVALKSVNCNIRHPKGYTPLYIAAQNRNIRAVQVLLQLGADVDKPDKEGTTAVWIAASLGFADVVSVLAKHKANLNIAFKNRTPLFVAIDKGFGEVINVLSHYTDVNQPYETDRPISFAIQCDLQDKLETAFRVRSLLQCQANPDVVLANGYTPVFQAICFGYVPAIIELARYGAHLNSVRNTRSPLSYAAELGKLDVIRALIDYGVDPGIQLPNTLSAMFLAAQNNHLHVVSALIDEYNVDPKIPSSLNIQKFREFGMAQQDSSILEKIDNFIGYNYSVGEENILVSPEQIANIMGHQEMVALIKTPKKRANWLDYIASPDKQDHHFYVKW